MLKQFAKTKPVLFGYLSALVIYAVFCLFPILILTLNLDQYINDFFNGIITRLLCSVLAIICLGILFQTNGFKYAFSIKGFCKGLIAAIPLILYILFRMVHLSLLISINTHLIFSLLPKAIVLYIIVAIFEESVSRGLLMGGMLKKWSGSVRGRIVMIVISAAIFGSLHVTKIFYMSLSNTIQNVISSALFGMGFASMYLFSKNLMACIVMHATLDICLDPITKLYGNGFMLGGDYKLNYMRDVFLPKAPNVMLYIVIPIFAIVMAIIAKPYVMPDKPNEKGEENT